MVRVISGTRNGLPRGGDGGSVELRGRVEGQALQRRIEFDEEPLYVNVAIGIVAFVQGGQRTANFSLLRTDLRSVVGMDVERGGCRNRHARRCVDDGASAPHRRPRLARPIL